MSRQDEFFAANRANWDERAAAHLVDRTGIYPIDRLLAGETLLTAIELNELPDLTGKRIVHFQSHIGTDTISLARMNPAHVVGIDFSPASVEAARELARKAGADASFTVGSVYDAPELAGNDFDLVFTTWGTICWLDDLYRWAGAIAGCLKPGGKLYFADAHPTTFRLEIRNDRLFVALPEGCAFDAPLSFDNDKSYAGDGRSFTHRRTYEWVHSAASVLNALIDAGLRIDRVNEHDAVPWKLLPNLLRGEDGLFRWPEGEPGLPLSWSVQASKDA